MCFEISTGQVQPDKVETVFERVWRASLNPECAIFNLSPHSSHHADGYEDLFLYKYTDLS